VEALLTFYKVYRAYVRGKVNSFQLDDDHISPEKKDEAAQRATKYFRLALSYSART
jgi:aminoglycoside phosphotransferase family enzyme